MMKFFQAVIKAKEKPTIWSRNLGALKYSSDIPVMEQESTRL
jgi:hypothetical protein